jgi:hypothetical protein
MVSSLVGKRINSKVLGELGVARSHRPSAVNAAALTANVLIARPSSPSVMFTPLLAKTSTSTANTT